MVRPQVDGRRVASQVVVWAALALTIVLSAGPASAQLPYTNVKMESPTPLGKALAVVSAQTGIRFGGLSQLGAAANVKVNADGPLPVALSALGEQAGVIITRVGLYDWAVARVPRPTQPFPGCAVEPLMLRALGAWYDDEAQTAQSTAPGATPVGRATPTETGERTLSITLAAEAETLLDLARLADIDPASLKLTTSDGATLPVWTERFVNPDAGRRRNGYRATLPFHGGFAARSATLSGEATLFAEIQPVTVDFAVDRVQTADKEGAAITFEKAELVGGRWQATVTLRRPPAIGDETPWVEAALVDKTGALYRPRTIGVVDLGPAENDPDERNDSQCLLAFDLPENAAPTKLVFTWVARRKPWVKVPFAIDGITLPVDGASTDTSQPDGVQRVNPASKAPKPGRRVK